MSNDQIRKTIPAVSRRRGRVAAVDVLAAGFGITTTTKENKMKAIRTINIISGRPEDSGKRIKVGLFKIGEVFRWFGGNVGESPRPASEQDTEVSGKTVSEACENARRAWFGSNWGLRAKSLNF